MGILLNDALAGEAVVHAPILGALFDVQIHAAAVCVFVASRLAAVLGVLDEGVCQTR